MGRRHRSASPIPSSPRGRGLVEPYRPLGPLSPRAVRAVARLGPRPVADGHLVDVVALAAPPCGLAANCLHAGGLQALVHARVPHSRYAGMRGGQVVVAGEHLAPRAVRAARVRLALARSVRYEAGPLVALLALPPDALVGVGDHVGRLQVAVALLVPLPRDLGMRRPQVVVAFQHLAVAAVGATTVSAAGSVVSGYLPCVPMLASPPDPPRAAGDDAVGPQVAVQPPIPLSQKLGVLACKVVEAGEHAMARAVRAAQPLGGPLARGHLPFMATASPPPDLLGRIEPHAVGPQVAVVPEIPFSRELGMRGGQVVKTAQQLAVPAVRAAVVDAHGAHAHLLAPDVAARSAPPHHGACVGVEVLGAQAAVQLGVELPGDVRPL